MIIGEFIEVVILIIFTVITEHKKNNKFFISNLSWRSLNLMHFCKIIVFFLQIFILYFLNCLLLYKLFHSSLFYSSNFLSPSHSTFYSFCLFLHTFLYFCLFLYFFLFVSPFYSLSPSLFFSLCKNWEMIFIV